MDQSPAAKCEKIQLIVTHCLTAVPGILTNRQSQDVLSRRQGKAKPTGVMADILKDKNNTVLITWRKVKC